MQSLAKHLFKIPTDSAPKYNDSGYKWLRHRFFSCSWHEAYDVLEFLVLHIDVIQNPNQADPYYRSQCYDFLVAINGILGPRALAGYRFINGVLSPISNPIEISAIEVATSAAASAGLSGVHEHLITALEFLGRKPVADFRNSVKESISAVEATVNLISGTNGNGVAGAIDSLSSQAPIHGALKTALKQLYGYTSDSMACGTPLWWKQTSILKTPSLC